ncbi:MAG: ABC-2 family transporter protein [Thermoguttaceae bacterium]|jgi:ABC-2 type transport system permease protein
MKSYIRVFLTLARNSFVRDMTFRANFIIDLVTWMAWMLMNLLFYILIFRYTPEIGVGTGWEKYPFFIFVATSLLVNSVVEMFFMMNMDELSELIRTGALDFALVKPIDTQFLVSLTKTDWSAMGNFFLGLFLLGYSLLKLGYAPQFWELALYPVYIVCGVAIYYSLMVAMAAASVWLGRNLTLMDFWFSVTMFSRYPMEIYQGRLGAPLRRGLTFVVPVLVAVNVPARLLVRSLSPQSFADWLLPIFTIFATLASLGIARWIFQRAITSYRSASS